MKWTSVTVAGVIAVAWISLGPTDDTDTRHANAAAPSRGFGIGKSAEDAAPAPKFDPDLVKEAHAFVSSAPEDRVVSVARGDTLMNLLTKNGVDRREAHAAIQTLSTVYDVRRLQIGQDITLTFRPLAAPDATTTATDEQFLGLALQPTPERDVTVQRASTGRFVAEEIERTLQRRDAYATAIINSSLYDAALAADLPIDVLMDVVRVFSFDVDFQRDIQTGDRFEVLYDGFDDDLGNRVRNGVVRYAAMTLSGKTLAFYRHTPSSDVTDYFDPKGRSVRKTLMRTPIDGARLSSRFGKRKHPILGYTKVHKGVDFAARSGTPIMAAGDGVVEKAGRNGAYGNYLRIRHNGSIKTAYGHLSKFARGVRAGTRVKQGQIVAYVGSTGRSTGPHLHYEVLVNGRPMNPMSVKLPAGEQLKGKDLKSLQTMIPDIDQQVAAARSDTEMASR